MARTDITAGMYSMIIAVIIIVAGIFISLQLKSSTLGDYTVYQTNAVNNTVLTSSGSHILSLGNIANDRDGTLVVSYQGTGTGSNVSISGTKLGSLDGTSPDSFTIDASLLNSNLNITYQLVAGTNITLSNVSYYTYSGCVYSYESCENMETVYNMTGTTFTMLPVAVLITAAMVVVGAVLLLKR